MRTMRYCMAWLAVVFCFWGRSAAQEVSDVLRVDEANSGRSEYTLTSFAQDGIGTPVDQHLRAAVRGQRDA